MKERKLNRRVFYLAAILVMVAGTGGFAAAAVFSSTAVDQKANFYEGGNSGAPGYSTAALSVTTTPSSISACTSGPVSGATSGGTVIAVLNATTGGTTCATGDFAEEFSVSFSATISTQTNTFTITTETGVQPGVQTSSVSVTLGTGTSGAFTQTVDIYVDYGLPSPPSGGITVLDLVIQ